MALEPQVCCIPASDLGSIRGSPSLLAHAGTCCPLIPQLVGGEMALLSDEVKGVAYPEIEAAAKGNFSPEEPEEDNSSGDNGGSGGGGAGGSGPAQRPQRRSKLPEMDWRDGAGI